MLFPCFKAAYDETHCYTVMHQDLIWNLIYLSYMSQGWSDDESGLVKHLSRKFFIFSHSKYFNKFWALWENSTIPNCYALHKNLNKIPKKLSCFDYTFDFCNTCKEKTNIEIDFFVQIFEKKYFKSFFRNFNILKTKQSTILYKTLSEFLMFLFIFITS